MTSHIEIVGEALLESTRQVFEEHGVHVPEALLCDPVGEWVYPIAVIGFGGETIRGSASFEVPWPVLQACHPSKSSATADLVDWVGELSNLVLGKLKTRLRAHSVAIQLGLPMTFTAGTAVSALTSASKLQYRLRSEAGTILVRFSAEIDPAFEMTASETPEVVHGIDLF